MATKVVKCPNCSAENTGLENYCRTCGTLLTGAYENQQMQAPRPAGGQTADDKRVVAGICGILLGGFGVHKFIMGYTTEGVIMLVTWVVGLILLCGIPSMVISIIGLIEGIMYLTKSDEEFRQTYVIGRKPWF